MFVCGWAEQNSEVFPAAGQFAIGDVLAAIPQLFPYDVVAVLPEWNDFAFSGVQTKRSALLQKKEGALEGRQIIEKKTGGETKVVGERADGSGLGEGAMKKM